MSNNMKFLLLNITLLAGMYCNCEYSRCAGCCKNCCWNEEEGNNNKNENIYKKNKGSQDATATDNIIKPGNCLNQQGNLSNNNANGKNDNKGNSVKNVEEGNSDENNNNEVIEEEKKGNNGINDKINEEDAKNQQDLYFKIEGGAIDNNDLKCFGKGWFKEYKKKKDEDKNSILLYKLTEQKNKEGAAGTLVYSKENGKLKYTNGGDFPKNLKKLKKKWAIFKVTTLNNEEKKGDSHIFYCSDVSTLNDCGLFEKIKCWSIEILAANTQGVETFYAMFYKTNSSLEQDTKKQKKSGFIGLEKLDVSSAQNLAMMFYEALYKQKTTNSLKDWILKNGADIAQMFYMNISKFVGKNGPNFRVLNKWIKENNVYLKYSRGHKYSIFFKGYDNDKKSDKLPKWYNDRFLKKNSEKIESIEKINIYS